jgi:hypothetical protein
MQHNWGLVTDGSFARFEARRRILSIGIKTIECQSMTQASWHGIGRIEGEPNEDYDSLSS